VQLKLLQSARRWYIDKTFKLVKDPFLQLLSIHVFIKAKDSNKVLQVPVCFIIMPSRTTADYRAVFWRLLLLIGKTLQEVVADFEKAIISAVKSEFPHVKFCAFHFCQALFRRLKRLGLSVSYKTNEKLRVLCRQVMCLHLLPKEKIHKAFYSLKKQASKFKNRCLNKLTSHIEKTWISSTTYAPKHWSTELTGKLFSLRENYNSSKVDIKNKEKNDMYETYNPNFRIVF